MYSTDSMGQVILDEMSDGDYEVYAFIDNYGSGTTLISVKDGLAQNVEVELIPDRYIEPQVIITSPETELGFATGELIDFRGNVSDYYSNLSELVVEWSSNNDGLLSNGYVEQDGSATLSITDLSSAEHIIALSVTNKFGISTLDTLKINMLSPPKPVLSILKNNDESVQLSWNKAPSDVTKIEVFRYADENNPEELIASIETATIDGYLDTLVPFAEEISYYLKYHNAAGYVRTSDEVRTIGQSTFGLQVHQAVIHDSQPLIYVRTDNKIIQIDYQSLSIVAEKTFENEVNRFEIGDNGFGKEVYVPSDNGNLYILNASNLQLKETINPARRVTSVVTDNNGLIYCSVDPFSFREDPIRVFKRSDLSFVSEAGDNDRAMLRMLPSNNEIIEITTRISPTDMDYHKFDVDGNLLESKSDKYHGDYRIDPYTFKIVPANNYLITSSSGAIYSADPKMDYKGILLDDQPGKFADFDFSDDGAKIYAGVSLSKSVFVYDSASLAKTNEISTRGYPMFIMKKENKLIVFCTIAPFVTQNHYYDSCPNVFGIEIISLD